MYNSLAALPTAPYKIMEYLATSPDAEDIWKLLRYNDYDALSKPNLTTSEKLKMLWRTGPQYESSVFLTSLVEDAIAESRCIMKVYDYYIHANQLYNGIVVYSFDFLYGGQMALVDYNGIPVSRGDLFIHQLLGVLNGAYIGGIGKLTFYDDLSRYISAKNVIGNSKTFTGVQIFLATMMGDAGLEDDCDG